MRKIIHCDCDSFYASVEMGDDPSLRGLPVAVGGSPDSRGVVATCNYAARAFGVHSAMPMSQAKRACPGLVIVGTNMEKYRHESARILAIFKDFTSLIEPLSLDEAFLDVSNCTEAQGSATHIAQEIRQRVREEIGITLSAGIAPNKFLAKIASDWNKPDGQFTITPDAIPDFMRTLPVTKIFGVGSVTANKMRNMGLLTCLDLQQLSLAELTGQFGKFGARLYQLCRGEDKREVSSERIRKSVSTERTFSSDLPDLDACLKSLVPLYADLERRVEKARCEHLIKSRTLKLRFQGFHTTTVSEAGYRLDQDVYQQLLARAWERGRIPVRLLGLGVQLKTENPSEQIELFDDPTP